MTSLQTFMPLSSQPRKIHTENSSEFTKACQELQWTHDTSTSHRSKNNGTAERGVLRAKEGTATTLVQRGHSEEWSNEAMECYCQLTSVHDAMAGGVTAYEI